MKNFLSGLGVMALGMVVVFVGLLILIGFIKILGVVTMAGQKKKNSLTDNVTAEKVSQDPAAPVVEAGIPADVVAAITAAIAAVWQGEKGFVVRHIRHINNAPAWNRAGREEQTYSRF
ncbi:MAG: OadG family protein [Candidatus Limiplasma sp.]|nr:OadG family protein [Candidatus Limiplasma sp.]